MLTLDAVSHLLGGGMKLGELFGWPAVPMRFPCLGNPTT